jgi:hypothetical protein
MLVRLLMHSPVRADVHVAVTGVESCCMLSFDRAEALCSTKCWVTCHVHAGVVLPLQPVVGRQTERRSDAAHSASHDKLQSR